METNVRKHEILVNSGGPHRIVRGRHGDFIFNHNDIYIGRSLEKYGEFSEAEVDLFKQLCRPGDLVVEVGANIGTNTIPIANCVGPTGRVLAFEPQALAFHMLCGNVALNNLTNVHCHPLAVGREEAEIFVPEFRTDLEVNLGGLSLENASSGRRVRQIKLDSLLELPRMRLLKIDVEGMESDVLVGCSDHISRLRPVIYVENDRVDRSEKLIEQIMALDYDLFWHLPPLYNPNNFAGDAENVFPNLISVNMLCTPKRSNAQINGLKKVTSAAEHPFKRG
ncbi:MAG: FkbM family methyltransferase [Planctomycetales bacterium]|nr:FkbM family methyltransferase [Planctomycetales bacterium]